MFVEKPATKRSLTKRKLVYGVGVNDADYVTSSIGGECPFYSKWVSMLSRCYSIKSLKRLPTYGDCSVCCDWLVFSNFKRWMIAQEWQGKHLDKDLLTDGEKIYSPESCVFISSEINLMLNTQPRKRGKLPQGVYFDKARNKYKAQCSKLGKVKGIGRFDTAIEAKLAYNEFKFNTITSIAKGEDEPLKSNLIAYAKRHYNERNNNSLRGNAKR